MKRRRSIPLRPDEHRALRQQYLNFRYPTDQYAKRNSELERFTDTWNASMERDDSSGDLLHYMVTKRKAGKWVRFDGSHKKLARTAPDLFSDEEWQELIDIYIDLDEPSDHYAFDGNLQAHLSAEFQLRTGRHVWGSVLVAALIDLRKDDRLPRLRDDFDDIDEIA